MPSLTKNIGKDITDVTIKKLTRFTFKNINFDMELQNYHPRLIGYIYERIHDSVLLGRTHWNRIIENDIKKS